MKYYIISGEASGDLHGSNLIKELKIIDSSAEFRCWGGDLMKEQGAEIVKHYKELAFMGFVEVIANLPTIISNLDFCKKDIIKFSPDVLILIDYPGFNLRIAEFAKKQGIRVFYYISPQLWAWKESRIKKIKRDVERMFVILPFEEEFYNRFKYTVDFVGHPLLDMINEMSEKRASSDEFRLKNKLSDKPIVALLPGSRGQEIKQMLPLMTELAHEFNNFQFVVAGTNSHSDVFYENLISDKTIKIIKSKTYDLLANSATAIVTSGTATLEAALFEVPEVVCYKGGRISFMIAKQLVKVKYISLVNLIMDDKIVSELIQDEFNYQNLRNEFLKLSDETYREKLLLKYRILKQKLGGSGASKKTANLIYKYLNSN